MIPIHSSAKFGKNKNALFQNIWTVVKTRPDTNRTVNFMKIIWIFVYCNLLLSMIEIIKYTLMHE